MISIVIPFYNRAAYLPQTIASVLSQTDPNWECILVDDGSTDDSFSIVSSYVQKDPRLRLLQRPNTLLAGGNDARNFGWQHARSAWIMFLDSDDLITPDCIQQRCDATEKYPDQDLLIFPTGCFYHHIGDTDKIWSLPQTDEDDLYRFFHKDAPWHTNGVLWKKKSLQQIGGWASESKCFQDFEIHLRVVYVNASYKKVLGSSVDNFYRIADKNSESIASKFNSRQYRDRAYQTLLLIDKFKAQLNLSPYDGFQDFLIRFLIWEELHQFGPLAPIRYIFNKKRFKQASTFKLFCWYIVLLPTRIKLIRLFYYKIGSKRVMRFVQPSKCLNYTLTDLQALDKH